VTPAASRARPAWSRAWSRAWSTDSGLRALRATLVVPALFAVADQLAGNLQMATFASLGGFATLVLSSFGGSRRDKAVAHAGLALTGTALVVIGTPVSSSTLLASLVALPVTFVILYAGAVEPNAASGAMGALLAFVLSAVSAGTAPMIPERLAGWWMASAAVAARHASLRSVWFINSLRGALALAAAVSVARVTGVQHGFWVALGTLSVLHTSAASTGATAFRALAGTAAGMVIGSVLVVAIGSDTAVLWAMLPVAVCVAAYCPGKAPFAAGQAAFTVLVAVLFNLIVPVGWKVGIVRIEDVALGCAVSAALGALLWPRGAIGVVADDLADAFRQGSCYLAESVDWILGRSPARPTHGLAAVSASIRLDGALRGLLAEQGTKHVPKEHLCGLRQHLADTISPALELSALRRRPWWR